ncbi:TonB-dependent receptor [Novosphingobium sp. 1949]|uniref:TonB-dependent receptor n=1 Tax=Novosphingobium organovorum TaxID=2930092 RepID=A0ABT0BD19_9SPHN|nr:TonB-dependent receptor [Novosphingobium organovorum]MCJ2182790.1 TonB-dependent receptor [Novosphingobium organovorum]
MAFKPLAFCTASVFALSLAGVAHAQDTTGADAAAASTTDSAEPTAPEIIVTGVRASLMGAQSIKKNSVNIVDSIVAEDIGKLPDNTVSDALQRVTGVQIQRAAGEASSVQIRGLSDVATLINGREAFTGTSRSVSLADIPAELVAGVDVYKTSTPDIVEGGVAGVVDVRLRRPFDFDGLTVAGGVRGIYSDQSDKKSYVASGLVSDRWETGIGEVGFLLAASYNRRKYQDQDAFNYVSNCVEDTADHCNTDAPYYGRSIPDTVGGIYSDGDRRRLGINSSLQWNPSADLSFHVDGMYTRYQNRYSNTFFIALPKGGTVTSTTGYDDYDFLSSGTTTTNAYTLTSKQAYEDQTDSYQINAGGEWTTGKAVFSSELTYNHSKLQNRNVIVDTSFNAPSMTIDNDNGGTPHISITGVDMTDPSNYTLRTLFDNHSVAVSEQWAWRGDMRLDIDGPFLKNIKIGTRYTHRTVDSQATTSSGIAITDAVTMDQLSSDAYTTSPTGLVKGATGIGQFLVMDTNYLLNNTDTIRELFGQADGARAYDPANAFSDVEDTYAFYGSFEYGFDIGSMPVTGVGGARVVNTVESLTGYDVSSDQNYLDILPSINAKVGLSDTLFLRLAWGKTLTRPQFADLNPLVSYSPSGATGDNGVYGSGSGGNPDLTPIRSTAYDASLEFYPSRSTSFTVGGYYRTIDGYIQTYSVEELGTDGNNYLVSRPRNTHNGYLAGAEVAYQQFFDFLPGAFSGLGVQLNGTYSDGKTDDPLNGGRQRIVNVSHWSYNAVAIYEKYGISARLAYNWRSSYVVSYNSGGDQAGTIMTDPTGQLDFSASYDVTPAFTLTFNATNITDRTYHDRFKGLNGDGVYSDTPRDTRTYDRTFEFGARFKF